MEAAIKDFISQFEELFDDLEPNTITGQTVFRDIDEWSSLVALMVIAMVDENYDVKLAGDDIRVSVTVGDLYEKVKAKQA